jgi:phosphoglycolate phosphatase
MKIIFDLDGTLICSKLRLYSLFDAIVPESNLTFDEYWALKFQRKTNKDIVVENFSYDEFQVQQFISEWMAKIEDDEYLNIDTPIDGVFELLSHLEIKYDLYVCTARQFKEKAKNQLSKLDMLKYFEDVLVTEQQKTKSELIKDKSICLNSSDLLVGDTGSDVLQGKILGLRTVAVLTGFMSKEALQPYAPDMLIRSVVDLKEMIL